ncbi:MAG: YbjN domain-containing protein, partial [Geobacter sp.]|nr:YbjN domain-containing protein [Geobacter sp.]
EGLPLGPALFKSCVYANVSMMDQYFPGIMSIVYAEISPAELIDQIEG